MGDKFDKKHAQTLKAGAFLSMPAKMNHYAWASTAAVIQLHGQGPLAITYVNPADDPSTTGAASRSPMRWPARLVPVTLNGFDVLVPESDAALMGSPLSQLPPTSRKCTRRGTPNSVARSWERSNPISSIAHNERLSP
jgi:hypothetical protein